LAVDSTLEIRESEDVVRVRQAVRAVAAEIGLNLVDQTKIITAASEIARNTLGHGGGGTVQIQRVQNGSRPGVRLTFEDQGPGIADLSLALRDGYTTGGGLGLGLSGSKRLCNEFEVSSVPGEGTRVVLTKWKA
jgi:serine/threonine-protein kinase RsbT